MKTTPEQLFPIVVVESVLIDAMAKEVVELVKANGFSKTESGIEFEPLPVYEGVKAILKKHLIEPAGDPAPEFKIPAPKFKVGDRVIATSGDGRKTEAEVVKLLGYGVHGLAVGKTHAYDVEQVINRMLAGRFHEHNLAHKK